MNEVSTESQPEDEARAASPSRHGAQPAPEFDAASSSGDAVEGAALSTLEQTDVPTFEPNRWLRWLYGRFFRHMAVDAEWSDVVRESASKGIVVYVIRSIPVLDFLCLDYLLKRFRLPLVRFVNDLGLWILEPFGRGERRLRRRPQIPQPEALAKVLHDRESALLFLRRPPTLGERPTGQELDVDLIRVLVEQQRKVDRPILLVPQTFIWTRRPPNKKPSVIDLLFGPSQWPGRIRVFLRFVFNYRNAQLRSGRPFDVQAFLESHQQLTDAEAADRIRYAMLRRMERERHAMLGPAKKTAGRVREEILQSPRIQPHLEKAAASQSKPLSAVVSHADKELRRLCANMDPNAIRVFQRLLNWVWTRIYDGHVIDLEGMARAREAAHEGPLILLPSHKSHVDYLVLSDVLDQNGIAAPLIAAGDNLAFFPLGPFLRRCGAFFIRRSFRGRKLYAALVDAYLRKILLEGFNLEFFLEGGRSRTGKLLPPKLGLLSMVVDAGLKLRNVNLSFVPVSIGYERIIEEGAYTHELGGGDKQPENIGGLLRTPRVLRSRYGRLYVQFGEILRLEDLLDEAAHLHGDEDRQAHELKPTERRALINRIAHRVTYEIDRATIVTPAALMATALMSFRDSEVTHDALLQRCGTVLATLQRSGARIARSVLRDDAQVIPPPPGQATEESALALLREDALEEARLLFQDAKLVETTGAGSDAIHRVPESRRLALEYHKNTVLHFFVPYALISSALVVAEDQILAEGELRERVRNLSRLFKYEFMYRADASFDDIFEDACAQMQAAGEIERTDEGLRVMPESAVPVYAEMLRTYFESYRLAVRALDVLGPDAATKKKDWVKQALSRGGRMAESGALTLTESLSRQKLQHALSALRDEGLVALKGDGLRAGAAMADDEALSAFERRIAKYLRPAS
ncbi:MAG: 1-acyl-sn-glycerol-3-phosphate acyltransferase [Sandaracinaceae bacterium]